MQWRILSFLAEPWFVIPWYAIGVLGAALVIHDLRTKNTPLKPAMKWAWPIIVVFFSVLGLALYYGTARAPGIGAAPSDGEKKAKHHAYQRSMGRRVNGAVIHCVAGDGLGIMTAMVIARAFGFTFWQEFWFEYAVGFAFGWFIFQWKSMAMMTESKSKALALAFRAEFFSMLSVMGGMGAVMTFVTPAVVGAQPSPLTWAFWGFGMLGLVAGYVLTFPTNWMMVKLGWKHGMGSMEDAEPAKAKPARIGLVAATAAWGLAALVLPAWLTEVRERRPLPGLGEMQRELGAIQPHRRLAVLKAGLRASLQIAADPEVPRHDTTHALDAAMRVARVGAKAAPRSGLHRTMKSIEHARRALQLGDAEGMLREIHCALDVLDTVDPGASLHVPGRLSEYEGVPVLDAHGIRVGEVTRAGVDNVQLALGGIQDVWGFWDLTADILVSLPTDSVVFGPVHTIGKSYVVLPIPNVER